MKGLPLLPDPLADLPRVARLRQEEADAEYIRRKAKCYTMQEAINRPTNTWAGVEALVAKDYRPYRTGMKIDAVVCGRVDLDHPINFLDNLFTTCDDCGCDIQHRPYVPESADKICISCAARRYREK